MPTDPTLLYRNPQLPISDRVTDLLARMTVPEKVAQLGAVWLNEVLDGTAFSQEKAHTALAANLGTVVRAAGGNNLLPAQVADATAALQTFIREHTRLGIPAIIHDECCSGFMARGADAYPHSINLASTWNPALAEAETTAIRAQMRAVGVHHGLAPDLDVVRDPRWGRLEETFGEDPYLAAVLGVAYVRGLQGPDLREGIAATGKHFAAHGLPQGGLNWAPVHIGPRELREEFLVPFEAAVREAGLATIMNAYHELDGIPCGASRELLTDILRGEWGFSGAVFSDYDTLPRLMDYHFAAADKSEAAAIALEAGLEVELSRVDVYGEPLLAAIESGRVPLAVLDEAVRRVLALKFRLGLFDNPTGAVGTVAAAFNQPAHRALSREIARQGIVLLKNEGDLLPLPASLGSLAVIGPNADRPRHMVGDYAYASMADFMDSGEDDPAKTTIQEKLPPMLSVLAAIRQQAPAGLQVRYAQGCDYKGASRDGFAEAVEAARASEVAVLVMGGRSSQLEMATGGETRDRASLNLPGIQDELVRAVLATGTPVVLVLVDGRPAAIPALAEGIPAILEAWLPGQEGGPALAEILFGQVNPSGKLPVTFPRSVGQVPIYYRHKPSAGRSFPYNNYVDESAQPWFPFGHGLSYTSFEYGDLSVSPSPASPTGEVTISLTVKNTGSREGAEVVQLYVRDVVGSVTRPVKELKGFHRFTLQPGESRTVTFTLSVAQMAFYNRAMEYVVEPGAVEVMVGSSSGDVRLTGQFEIAGPVTPIIRKVFFSRSAEH
jgi:beta-glucosidase